MKEKKVDKIIINTLFDLLTAKPLSEISVTELIAKSGVSRSSYYRNFYLLEDVIRKYGTDLFDRLALLPQVSPAESKSRLTMVYKELFSERSRLTVLDRRKLLFILNDGLFDLCSRRINSMGVYKGQYQAEFYAGASASIIRAWIHNGFKETPEEMAEITYSFLLEKQQ